MKRFFIVLLLGLFYVFADAQSQQVKVVYKNGTSVVGTMVGMDGTTSVTISLVGVEIPIPIEEVATIEPVAEKKTETTAQTKAFEEEWTQEDFDKALPSDHYGEYVILDKKEYPDSFTVVVGDQTLTMLLVRGGVFNMGYDEHGSLSMHSEPVHKVKLSSYYTSKEYLNEDVAYSLLGLSNKAKVSQKFETRKWDEAKQIVDKVAEQTGLPYRLLTEAEWEYAAVTSYAEALFTEYYQLYQKKFWTGEWCSDLYAKFSAKPQIDPHGSFTGKDHVHRTYSWNTGEYKATNIWNRSNSNSYGHLVRLAINADQIIDKLKND